MTILSWMTDAVAVGRRALIAPSFATLTLVVVACATLPPTGPAVGVEGPTSPAAYDPVPTPPVAVQGLCAEPTFTPYEVAPEVRNVEEVRQALVREYPPDQDRAVAVWISIR